MINKIINYKFTDKIQDFGEKIEGAKKDTWQSKLGNVDLESITEKKNMVIDNIIPKPDYKELVSSGVDKNDAAYIFVAREEVKRLLRKYKKRTLDSIKTEIQPILDAMKTITKSGEIKKYFEAVQGGETIKKKVKLLTTLGFPTVDVSPNIFSYEIIESTDNINKDFVKYFIVKGRYIISKKYDSFEDAAIFLSLIMNKKNESGKSEKLKVYSWKSNASNWIIGKKIGAGKYIEIKSGFKTSKDANQYLKENSEELVEQLQKLKEIPDERRAENRERLGKDHTGGKNVTPEKFQEKFGFRGVQFGNYVEGAKRQIDLNESFNALVDIANILNIPTEAISLNGELGLAFGARGSGKYSAHYEPGQIVINLTKKRGAGALAHEWFHALDNYFGRLLGVSKFDTRGFITQRPLGIIKNNDEGTLQYGETREESVKAFKKLVDIIDKTDLKKRSAKLDKLRSKPYWATIIELAARTFETYVIDRLEAQGVQNDYLANIKDFQEWGAGEAREDYPYPLESERKVINEAFDNLFQTLETKQTDKCTALY